MGANPKITLPSPQEMQVIRGVSDGLTNSELAALLNVSPSTIKSHLARIAHKLGTGDRAGMVGVGFRAGWLR